jgi:hypothetical protein
LLDIFAYKGAIMLRRIIMVVPLMLALCAGSSLAQSRFSLELNGGAAFPTEDLGTAALESGFGAGITATVRVMRHVHLYGGWDYHRFVTDQLLGTAEYDVDDTGYALGAKFQHPMTDRIDSWLRVGALYNHIELEDPNGDIVSDSGHELGWEAGAGASVAINERFSIMPGARFRTYSATLDLGTSDVPVDLTYITAEVRFAIKLGGTPVSAIQR